MQNLRWKIVTVIVTFVVFVALGIYPILAARRGITSPGWLMDKQLKLGLDLKGGVHLVMKVQTDDALKLECDIESERLRESLKAKPITFGDITTIGPTQFRVDGVAPATDAAFRTAAQDLQNFDRGSGNNGSYIFTMKPNVQLTLREEAVVQARQTLERRVNELGVAEPSISQQGTDQIQVQLPGVADVQHAKDIMGSPSLLELKIVEQGPSPAKESLEVNGQAPAGMEIVPGSTGTPGDASTMYYLVRKASVV